MKEYIIEKNELSEDRVLSLLRKYGIVIVNEYLNNEEVEKLNLEYDMTMELDRDWCSEIWNSTGKCVAVNRLEMDEKELPVTHKIFSNALMKNLAGEYIDENVPFNSGIYFCYDKADGKHNAHDLHFDVERSLKFYIYLHDTNVENAAFHFQAETHKSTAKIRDEYKDDIDYKDLYKSRELPSDNNLIEAAEGKAGTMIIFDTDLFHKAGTFASDNGDRRIIRAHTMDMKTIVREKAHEIPTVSFGSRVVNKLKRIIKG